MAEQSQFWSTNGTGDGASGGYNQQRWYDFLRKIFTTDQSATEGVLLGESNELAVSGTSSPLSVATGSAIVYGFFYENTAALSLTVTTPAATTGGRVVLEADWTAQTVRGKVVLNTSGVTTPPALTQSAGSTYQISLATFTITAGGAITLTDTRSFCHFGTAVNTAMIDNDAVDDTKAGNRILRLDRRQGGNATGWSQGGTNNYTPTTERMQCGAFSGAVNASSGTISITYPVAFSNNPLAWAIQQNTSITLAMAVSSTSTTLSIYWKTLDGTTFNGTIVVNWFAVGPE